jgi:hypothetical protein
VELNVKIGSVAMWRAATPKAMKFKACLGNFKAENFTYYHGLIKNPEIVLCCP